MEYRLKLRFASGLEQFLFLDADSYLLLGKELVQDGLARDLERPRAWFFDDYRSVDGVLLPSWVYVEEMLFSREYVFESIEANAAVDDALFEPRPMRRGAIADRSSTKRLRGNP